MSALGAAVALLGRGRAMEAGGPSRVWVSRGSLGAALGKMGLPGSGVGAGALGLPSSGSLLPFWLSSGSLLAMGGMGKRACARVNLSVFYVRLNTGC